MRELFSKFYYISLKRIRDTKIVRKSERPQTAHPIDYYRSKND